MDSTEWTNEEVVYRVEYKTLLDWQYRRMDLAEAWWKDKSSGRKSVREILIFDWH
jgi:hypothetical protein